MSDLLGILKTYETWIYVGLGLVGLWYIRKVISAVVEWQGAVFGLEKEKAQKKISESASVVILLIIVAAGWFILVSFVSPNLPNMQAMATPTLDLLATQTATLPVAAISAGMTPTVNATDLANATSGCLPGEVEFTTPENGSSISGKVTLKGNVNIADFGFYKYEFTIPGSTTWNTIAAGSQTITNAGDIGIWDTSQLPQGDYQLRLVVTDHQGNELPPCVVQIRITAP